ncbi:hypothetical protein AAZX31_02G196600 [Glycine max]
MSSTCKFSHHTRLMTATRYKFTKHQLEPRGIAEKVRGNSCRLREGQRESCRSKRHVRENKRYH